LDGACTASQWTSNYTFCDVKNFGDGGVCNCGCGDGAVDPDCYYSSHRAPVCPLIGQKPSKDLVSCSADGWKCDPEAYGDGKKCDCECGIPDPDCENLKLDTTCEGNAYCYKDHCSAPRSWMPEAPGCQLKFFNAGDKVCNCACGAFDPDCVDQMFDYIYGCNALNRTEYSCSEDGTCAKAYCGNGILEAYNGEECDGTPDCTMDCECSPKSGYYKKTVGYGCEPMCGDGIVAGDEECDGGMFCNETLCECEPGHPRSNVTRNCTGCGNGILDAGEECDGGSGCQVGTCLCLSGYKLYATPETGCYKQSDWTAVVVIAVCAGTAVLAVLVLVVWAVLSRRTKRIVAEAETVVEQNNEILRGEDTNIPVPGQIPTALLQTEVGTYDNAGGAADGAWGSTNMGGVGNGNGLDLSDDEEEGGGGGGMGGGMTLDDDEEEAEAKAEPEAYGGEEEEGGKKKHKKHSKKKKTIRITAQPPPPGSQE